MRRLRALRSLRALPPGSGWRGIVIGACFGCFGSFSAAAQTPAEPPLPDLPPALDLPPAAPAAAAPARGAGALNALNSLKGLDTQLWLQHFEDRVFGSAPGTASAHAARLVLDYRREWNFGDPAAGWRAGFSDRFDAVEQFGADPGAQDRGGSVNSLREAWVSRRGGAAARPWFVDAGRINWRLGVASGYNPTDFLKSRAVRTATSLDPGALRYDRLGTVMLRGQSINDTGAWTAAFVPQLSQRDAIDERNFAPALERTNRKAAGILKWAPQLSQRGSVDALLFARDGERPQFGLNGTWLASDSLVLHAEWAGGPRVPLAGPDQPAPARTWSNRSAIGATWTAPGGLELTVEHHYAGDALSRADWRDWRSATSVSAQTALAVLAQERAALQEPLVRSGWFARAAWHDAFGVRGTDLSAFVQGNGYDGSKVWQLKLSYRLNERWALTGQAGGLHGSPASEFGSTGLKRYVATSLSVQF